MLVKIEESDLTFSKKR